jgi:hypothetical protein
MLAVKLNIKNAVLILAELNANPYLRPFPFSRTPLE